MTVLIACDKFKGSLTAAEVCASLRAGLLRARPGLDIVAVPIADGGDGTAAAAVSAGYEEIEVTVSGPTGVPLTAMFALDRPSATAVVEMAQASGLERLPGGVLSPLAASSYGTGELVLAALDAGARTIILAVGGSACTDGGAGFLQALGMKLRAADGTELLPGGGALNRLAAVDLSRLDPRLTGCHFILASDVDNVLVGPHGAAAVYGPQKGATAADVAHLDGGLSRFAGILGRTPGIAPETDLLPGAGAAGGLGYAAMTVLGAEQRPGVEVVMGLAGFEAVLKGLTASDLVITGEGSLDDQTLSGKAAAGVALAARAAGVPAIAVCGQRKLTPGQLEGIGIAQAYALTDIRTDVRECMDEAADILQSTTIRIAEDWL
ncbi:glycerate kinase [Arthrobacter sp. SO3]|uniref:glycerate kinase n=1 Tax=Arthrobacter sp. SO3 TaxID=1897057 RepID=UPI001CFFA0FB|nr:glycerate kinase [Arthrobacter sp. SO3]MCB5292696.1 Glycerate 2-kinase [Arthrobacter sp. SO3]